MTGVYAQSAMMKNEIKLLRLHQNKLAPCRSGTRWNEMFQNKDFTSVSFFCLGYFPPVAAELDRALGEAERVLRLIPAINTEAFGAREQKRERRSDSQQDQVSRGEQIPHRDEQTDGAEQRFPVEAQVRLFLSLDL